MARFLADKLRRGDTGSFPTFFATVERCLLEGDEDAVALVMVGLLEDLQNAGITDIHDHSVWTTYLGPTTLRAWQAVEAFWRGDVNAIEEFSAWP